jgi:squalene-hopene/tetraprenyl-beta-curcumene cyclase
MKGGTQPLTVCPDLVSVERTLALAARRLLESRVPAGHWEGELSSSALSTATATAALALVELEGAGTVAGAGSRARLAAEGLKWLARNQNADGGWGDTVLSPSNISTTALAWAAFNLAGGGGEPGERAVRAARSWLERAAGSVEPPILAEAIARRYGKDRTFSVPILTVLALAGRLGPPERAWRLVPPLPFELAACPQRWFRWLRLPVVSYALPALIALGLVRHHHLPSRNPALRALRRGVTRRVRGVLERIQPGSGGFLEAVPLTSFVVLSLAAQGRGGEQVARRGTDFLERTARADGSWPIDSNLATWVTTLSVKALAGLPEFETLLPPGERRRIAEWLLAQQGGVEHPYTGASPGGWAWTDLPGGVPDADDTAGAVLALGNLAPADDRAKKAALRGTDWLLGLQNRDGGIPTFCRGWGTLPFDRSSPDLTAHALLAWLACLGGLERREARRVEAAIGRAVRYLDAEQRPDGAWCPLWFGNPAAPGEENLTYGTARTVVALIEAEARGLPGVTAMTARALRWLIAAQNADGGWGGAGGTPSSIEETGLALEALAAAGARGAGSDPALSRAARWLEERIPGSPAPAPAPIGLYFAKLWYYEKLYPLIFATGGLARLRRALGAERAEGATRLQGANPGGSGRPARTA